MCIQWHIFNHKKWGNPAICDYTNVPWGCYVKWHESDRERQVLCSHLYVESDNIKLIEEVRYVVSKGRVGGWRACVKVIKTYKIWVIWEIISGDIIYNMMTTADNTFLYIGKFLWERSLKYFITRKNIHNYVRRYVLTKLIVMIIYM